VHTAADTLTEIRRLWPELDTTPTGRRHDLPRAQTPEQRERARARWESERADQLAGHTGRGASPAPGNLDQLAAKISLGTELCELADRVASRIQRPARRGLIDPGHWDYTHRHGAPWAITWLLGALADGVPALIADDIGNTARHVLQQLQRALDGQTERPAGRCPCGTRLTVADWDDLITCTGCGTAYGRRDWIRLADLGAA